VSYEVQLDRGEGRAQTEESFTVVHDDGRREAMRLHEYARVYAIPGLYDEVVYKQLRCTSPQDLTRLLLAAVEGDGRAAADLRVFDLGAGNGVMGEHLAAAGAGVQVGSDNIAEARDAALRDRPGVYEKYLVGELDQLPEAEQLVRDRGLNALVCAGALGMGHIPAESFGRLWAAFPAGSWFAVSVHEGLADPGASDFGDWLDRTQRDAETEVLARERIFHRETMAREEIHYLAIVARRR
jgi:hypothetical protein